MIDGNTRHKKRERGLSPTQLRVLKLIAEGWPTSEIEGELSISAATIHHHRAIILERTQATSITQAVLIAIRRGWLNLDELDVEL